MVMLGTTTILNMKVMVIKIKKLSKKECPDEIKPYLKYIITNLQKSGTWKIQLTIAINFFSSRFMDEEQVMHSKNNNAEVMSYDNPNEVIE